MMSSDSNRFHRWSTNLFFFLFCLPWIISFVSSTSDVCADGTYQHEGKTCCLCAKGLRLTKHCSDSKLPNDRVCVHCEEGTYRSNANALDSCETCTSCIHPNANLEVEENCTVARDTVCRCKKDHYCDNGKETCTFCLPCKDCGVKGIETACTATTNTVCKDKESGGVNLVAVLVPLFVVILCIAGLVLLWKKGYLSQLLCGKTTDPPEDNPPEDTEPLRSVDLSRHLLDIAAALGWRVMRRVALHSGRPQTTIDSFELNHPNDCDERTFQLLSTWVEQQGSKASVELIQILQNIGEKGKVEKVKAIINRNQRPGGNSDGEHVSSV